MFGKEDLLYCYPEVARVIEDPPDWLSGGFEHNKILFAFHSLSITEAGGQAAASHTGALAGSDKIYDAAFKQAGIIRIANAEEMFDVIKALLYCPLPKGNKMGIIANSGGVCVETIDRCVELGLDVPTLPPETQEEILKYIGS